ncbi:MAG TPA: amidohydrolase family protein [Pyrinomonadaceae bacterium]|nr:amidohydrolase family protein [Pyrinomonadaceae bacterium]
MKILAADHVLPISSPPIHDGAVAFDEGKIVAVGTRYEIARQFDGIDVEDLGNAAILPGFVNCHSHLEITGMRNQLDDVEHDFASWLLKLNSIRADLSDGELLAAAINGAREGAAAGVTCFGDIGRRGDIGVAALKEVGLRGVVYQETEFSPDNRTSNEDFLALATKFETLKADETELVKIGLSPHSPYTVSSQLFELIAQYAIINRVPLSIHAAESLNEIKLLAHGTGFFSEVYEKFDLEWHSPHSSPIEYLDRLGVLSARPLLGHCVHLSDDDISRIESSGSSIAHCPKSNAKFGHGAAPLERFLDSGITVGIGSDSVASNNLCDIIEEARFATLTARNRSDANRFIQASEMLRIATLGGAESLGLDAKIGSLEAGKQADLAVISLNHSAMQPLGDIEATIIFSGSGRDVVRTIVEGNVVYST